jgi:hypothetical protein
LLQLGRGMKTFAATKMSKSDRFPIAVKIDVKSGTTSDLSSLLVKEFPGTNVMILLIFSAKKLFGNFDSNYFYLIAKFGHVTSIF